LTSHIKAASQHAKQLDTASKGGGEGNKRWPSGRVALSSHFGLQKNPLVTRNALDLGEIC
jgi:hypothetical protein